MAITNFEPGDVICTQGDPVDKLFFVTKGSVKANFFGDDFSFTVNDILGLTCIGKGVYTTDFVAETETNIFSYSIEDESAINNLLNSSKNPDLAYNVVVATIKQISKFLNYRISLEESTKKAYTTLKKLYPKYQELSALYSFSAKLLPGALKIDSPESNDPVGDWLKLFYADIDSLEAGIRKPFFHGKGGISLGFFYKCIEDIDNTIESCRYLDIYLQEISKELFNTETVDMFNLISELHTSAFRLKGANETLSPLVQELVDVIKNNDYIEQDKFEKIYSIYQDKLNNNEQLDQTLTETLGEGVSANLSNSLDTILQYSGQPGEVTNLFAKLIYQLVDNPDPNGSDDESLSLRREITKLFFDIYQGVFMNSLQDIAIPTAVKMFLNFGYVDPVLAGGENANYLYSIADSYKGDKEKDVYTMYEWLKAVYAGDKEPSRNESDLDWVEHLRDLRIQRRITEDEERDLLKNQDEKLKFEIENVLPVVNKISFGRISTYCPVFSSHNAMKDLNSCLVTTSKLYDAMDEVRKVDFSAYYRERPYGANDPTLTPYKLSTHIEVMPEIILTPNVGNRGIMWQERSGRNNGTPARMFISVFYLEDLNALIKHLTGELRWEYIKRIQGGRWSDISDPSLTSEYFDYLQFYRSSKELTKIMKEDVKTELARSRNTYKTVFSRNYVDWIVHEVNGSQRLNKIARRILAKYIPFEKPIRERLSANPQYAPSIKIYEIAIDNKARIYRNNIQRMERDKVEVPPEVLAEIDFLER